MCLQGGTSVHFGHRPIFLHCLVIFMAAFLQIFWFSNLIFVKTSSSMRSATNSNLSYSVSFESKPTIPSLCSYCTELSRAEFPMADLSSADPPYAFSIISSAFFSATLLLQALRSQISFSSIICCRLASCCSSDSSCFDCLMKSSLSDAIRSWFLSISFFVYSMVPSTTDFSFQTSVSFCQSDFVTCKQVWY